MKRIGKGKQSKVTLFGGPYDGEKIKISIGTLSTLTFRAKGMKGCYTRDWGGRRIMNWEEEK